MNKIVDEHIQKSVERRTEILALAQKQFELYKRIDFLEYDAATFMSYAIILIRKYCNLKFTMSVEEREEHIRFLESGMRIRLLQDNHDDGSFTVRLVVDRKEDNES